MLDTCDDWSAHQSSAEEENRVFAEHGRQEAVEYVPGTPSVAPGREPSNRPRERTALFPRS